MKNYKEIFIEKTEVSEIDLDPPFWEPDADEPNEIEYCQEEFYQEAPSMDIEELHYMLEMVKRKGANRVYIVAHSDHQGYEFAFVNLTEI